MVDGHIWAYLSPYHVMKSDKHSDPFSHIDVDTGTASKYSALLKKCRINTQGHALFPIHGKTTTRMKTGTRINNKNTLMDKRKVFEGPGGPGQTSTLPTLGHSTSKIKKSNTSPEISRKQTIIEDATTLLDKFEAGGLKRENSDVHISRANIGIDKRGNLKSEGEFEYVRSASDISDVVSNKTRQKLRSSVSSREGSVSAATDVTRTTGTSGGRSGKIFREHSNISADGVLGLVREVF